MQERHWHQALMSLLILGTFVATGVAQEGAASSAAAHSGRNQARSGRPSYGFLALLDQTVGLTPEQRDGVRGLLAAQRQASQALREETDGKIRALLNPEQQKRFDAFRAEQQSRRAARFRQS